MVGDVTASLYSKVVVALLSEEILTHQHIGTIRMLTKRKNGIMLTE